VDFAFRQLRDLTLDFPQNDTRQKVLEYPSFSLALELFHISKIVKIFLNNPRFESFENIESSVTIALK
jgi:hypothetical protein